MNDKGLRRQRLGITSPWIFKSVELAVAAKRLWIEVECPQGTGPMPWLAGRTWTDRGGFKEFNTIKLRCEPDEYLRQNEVMEQREVPHARKKALAMLRNWRPRRSMGIWSRAAGIPPSYPPPDSDDHPWAAGNTKLPLNPHPFPQDIGVYSRH